MDRLLRRGGSLTGRIQDLYRGEPALLAERSARHVQRGEHPLQPPRTDRHRGYRGYGVPLPLRDQGWWIGQQDLPLPGDQGAAQPRHARALHGGEDEVARYSCLSSLPHRLRYRWHIGREEPPHREARLYPLLRQPAHYG